jgi:hypothetical protein
MKRADILATASEYVTTDRAATHGNAEDNFRRIAELWNAYLGADDITTIIYHTRCCSRYAREASGLLGRPGTPAPALDVVLMPRFLGVKLPRL